MLSDNNSRIAELTFDSYTAYRKLDEGDALLTTAAIRRTSATAKYFYRVDGSDFIDWFKTERCDESGSQEIIHIAVAAQNEIIDVITFDLPNITVK